MDRRGGGRPRVGSVLAGAAIGCVLAATGPSIAAATVPTGYNPDHLPTVGCFWTGPFTAADDRTNSAYPGTEIAYWGAKFATPPGAVLRLRGRYAHARYQSLNAYVNDGEATNSLPDVATKPDPGSVNPYVPGHRRDLKCRSYTVKVRPTDVPADPAGNTLYAAPDSSGDSYQDILYRVYVPDRGRGLTGGTGVPMPSLRLADGTELAGHQLCDALNANHHYTSSLLPIATYNALVNWAGKDPRVNPALDPPAFEKFFNLGYSLAAYKTPAEQDATDATPMGTQYNNADARYMTASFSFRFGKELVLSGKMPRFPRTYGGRRTMTGSQLREWDMCVIESLVTTRTYSCLFDAQVPLIADRRYTMVISRGAQRPANARHECGVAWLRADPAGDGAGRPSAGILLTRNILPSPTFTHSSWDVETPHTAAAVMGAYYPTGGYESKEEFEALGCPAG
jgi:hypothetical protein